MRVLLDIGHVMYHTLIIGLALFAVVNVYEN